MGKAEWIAAHPYRPLDLLDRVRAMEESISDTLVQGLADPTAGSNVMAFLIVAGLGLGMALIYVPLRVFLTVTARSRRLRLLQRIRRLREELTQPVEG
ncbi:MAG: hypothetical protein O3C02_02575 [Cyanobacteria bacterium]|uniref:hypothetical protein n=2 Tax=Synechococcales TaxID=1890424 RepID=UPI00020020DC|nr:MULTISPECIES: hypothetical protein [Synechococcaceae]MDA0963928.1 hypothetical protein [Cyanobacteriota bacterium]MDA1157157.1 hypothetical protein [Cyanobacteriota bacterium]NCV93094.1 hypothetical protein [Synechococcaceae bacterium WB7_3xG_012]